MRDYTLMRGILAKVSASNNEALSLSQLADDCPINDVLTEAERLISDGLISGRSERNSFGQMRSFSIAGLTDEGCEFLRLIENDAVWEIVSETLRKADIDISYPLLKEVCEEIVKRYVASFIPKL